MEPGAFRLELRRRGIEKIEPAAAAISKILGRRLDPSTIYRWLAGERAVPDWIPLALRMIPPAPSGKGSDK